MYEFTQEQFEKEKQLSESREKMRQLKNDNPVEYEKIVAEYRKQKMEKEQQKQATKAIKKSVVNKKKVVEEPKYKALIRKEKVLLAKALKGKNVFMKAIIIKSTTIIQKIQKNITVKTYADAVSHLLLIDLITVLNLNVENGQNFKCGIIKDNIASINVDINGHYKYFTKSRDGQQYLMFNIIDLFEIIYNVNYYKALNLICVLAKINVEEGGWVNMQKIRYADNIIEIESASEEMAIRYPALYKYIEKHLYLLEKMNCIALKNIATQKESVEDESIFFTSARFIEEELKDTELSKDKSTINRVLNMFCCLGIIEKIPTNKVPKHMMARAKERVSKADYNFTVTFYKIPAMTNEVMLEAEKRVMKLNKAKVSALAINTNNLQDILGKRVFKAVFGDTVELTKIIKERKVKKKNEQAEMDETFKCLGL